MLLVLPACGDDEGPQRFEFERVLMGTPMRVALYAPDKQTATAAVEDTFARVERIEAAISSWQEDSEVRRLERRDWSGGDPVQISGPVYWCIRIGLEFAKESEGAFDVTAQPLIALWREVRKTRELPSAEALRKARSRVGSWQVNLDERMFEISLRPGVRFDFGAVGKGFALSEAASELSEWQLPSYMIQFGGEIAIGKPPPGRVGWRVQVPGWPEVLELASCAVATSGSSEQYVEIDGVRYAHVLDARTGMPLTEQREVTVISHSSLRADATATCIHILGPERAQEMLDQNAVSIGIIVKDGAVVWQSPTWPRPYHRGE